MTENEEKAFEALKRKLISKPILRAPNMKKGYVIYCDANTVAISGVLMQTGDQEGDEHVLSYTSRKLRVSEKNSHYLIRAPQHCPFGQNISPVYLHEASGSSF